MPLACRTAALAATLALAAAPAAAQPNEGRGVAFADVAYARTWDDEGLLGTGAALRGGAGFRLTRRLTVQAVVDRIPYYKNEEHLTFDGRVLFGGAELAFQSSRPRVRPFVTIGAGLMHDERIWIHKTATSADPRTRIETRTDHEYTLTMLTTSFGFDFRVNDRASIRAGVRHHGLLDTGDDLAPHSIIQPFVGAAYRW